MGSSGTIVMGYMGCRFFLPSFVFDEKSSISRTILRKRLVEENNLDVASFQLHAQSSYAFLFLETRSRNDECVLRNVLRMPTSITRKALDRASIGS